MNLLSEYCRRHDAHFIPPTSNGVCFFESGIKHTVCLTSTSPKTLSLCSECVSQSMVVVETFNWDDSKLNLVRHNHVQPDADLRRLVSGQAVPMKSEGDVEMWLWKSFLQHCRLPLALSTMISSLKMSDAMWASETMAHTAISHPRIYKLYYSAYRQVVSGRKYLLYE